MSFSVSPILNLRTDGATCTLLSFEDVNILLDCGWTDNKQLEKYEKYAQYRYYHKASSGTSTLSSSAEPIRHTPEPFRSSAASTSSGYALVTQGKVFSTVPVKYLASMNFRHFSLTRLPKKKVDRELVKKYFSRLFEVYDSIEDICFHQKQSFISKRR